MAIKNYKEWLPTELQRKIFTGKYMHGLETLDKWLDRVSGGDKEVRQAILDKKFIFGGRILSNRGLKNNGTYSNCYVLPQPEDSTDGIFQNLSEIANTLKMGGGVGVDLSSLRARGTKVNNPAKTSSGAVSFMDLYSTVTGTIAQNGRRGAMMISLDVNHGDAEEFINIKQDLNRVTKANTSLRVDEAFMMNSYDPNNKEHDMLRKVAQANWDMAEPGFLYWDRITGYNMQTGHPEFKLEGVNPCAELPLQAYGSCLLGSINLSAFVVDGKFDWNDFKRVVRMSVRALDDVNEEGLNRMPLKKQSDLARDWRNIGLGVMGLHDCLIKLGLKYNSVEARKVSDRIARVWSNTAIATSCMLAKERGAFPKWDNVVLENNYWLGVEDKLRKLVSKYGMRNAQLLAIAPTGSISTMLGCSNAIEPHFAFEYTRKTESLDGVDQYHQVKIPIAEGVDEELLVTTHDIHYNERIEMNYIWQLYVDNAISCTINMHEDATVEDIMTLYQQGYVYGLKGLTVFRNNCKRSGILTV
jgi:ribonucleoside-diphosphate reductase alpha chain